jgi:hypothetical protein
MSDILEIAGFGAKWDLDEHEGYLWLRDTDGNVHEEKVKSAKELHLLVHLLQTEQPIFYHPEDHYISTSMELAGDQATKAGKMASE